MATGSLLVPWDASHGRIPGSGNSATPLQLANADVIEVFPSGQATDWIFRGVIPDSGIYTAGAGVTMTATMAMKTATSGNIQLAGFFELVGSGTTEGTDNFDATGVTSSATAVPGSALTFFSVSWNFSSGARMANAVSGSVFRFKFRRVGTGSDTASGDMRLHLLGMYSQ